MTKRQLFKGFQVNLERFRYFMPALLNGNLVLSASIFMVYLIAPLFGGKWLPKALIVSAIWVGWALIGKFLWRRVYKKMRLKVLECILICSYGIICMFLWLPSPYNIVFSVLLVFGGGASYRAQIRFLNSINTSGNEQKDLHA